MKIKAVHSIKGVSKSLNALLIDSVANGASIGFIAPLSLQSAHDYWQAVDADLATPYRRLYLAFDGEDVIGSVQLSLCAKANGSHRGEVEKLMTLSFNKGDLLMFIAVLLWGVYTVGLRRKHNLSSIVLFASVVGWAFISTLPLTVYEYASGKTVWPEEKVWIIVGLIVLLPSFLSQICFIASVKLIGPARSGVFVNLVPVFASFLAVQLLGEAFEVYHGLSLFLVLSGIYIFEKYKPLNA